MTIDALKTFVQLPAVLMLLFVPVPAKPSLAGPPNSPYGPGSKTTGRWKLMRYDNWFASFRL